MSEKKQEIKDYLSTLLKGNDAARITVEKGEYDLWKEVLDKLENWNWRVNDTFVEYESLIVVDLWERRPK
jgi:flagellar basal body-associated protein FliL